jgi:predicted ATPase/class 3 adenylate cyclase
MSPGGRTLPSGTLTFLRSDIEGSMTLVRALGRGYDDLNAQHQRIVRSALGTHGGVEVRTEGDAFFAVFEDVREAVAAAADIQRAVASHPWPEGHSVRLRIGLHAGLAYLAGDDYGGFEVGRSARVAAMGAGGQVVLSDAVRALLGSELPEGCSLRDLGLHHLRDARAPERLFQLDVAGLPTEFPPLRSAAAPAERLPVRLTTFVGRHAELEALAAMLDVTRLLTLTGPGGTGKTSLAVEVARHVARRFEDGAWFADLQSVMEPAEVPGSVARALGLFDGPGSPAADRLEGHLARRELLLVLDNFEQVVDAADHLTGWLRAAPGLRAIVTSRAPLHVRGEQEYPVRPLAVKRRGEGSAATEAGSTSAGDDDGDAVALFADRLRAVRPNAALTASEQAVAVEICALLDGLPLAVELAAARGASLPLEVIRERLAAHLPLPGPGPRDLPDRQRTLEATIDWSHDLLPAPARRLFARLAVFEESFDLEQVAGVCGPAGELGVDALDGLLVLADQSLVERVDAPRVPGLRFRMLETVRSAALARLRTSGEEAEMRVRHAQAFTGLAVRAAPLIDGRERPAWVDRLAADDANLLAALRWAIEQGDVDVALTLAGSLWRYWLHSGTLHTGREMVQAALAMPEAEHPTPARLAALDAAGSIAYWEGDSARADGFYREQLDLAGRLGDPTAEGLAAYNLLHTRYVMGDAPGAMAAGELARQRFAAIGDERALARLDWALATSATFDDPVAGEGMTRDVLARLEALGDTPYVGLASGGMAMVAMRLGRTEEAFGWGIRGMLIDAAMRDRAHQTVGLQAACLLFVALGHVEESAILLGAFDTLCARYGVRPPAPLDRLFGTERPDEALREALGEERFSDAYERGGGMGIDEAIEVVVEVARRRGIDVSTLVPSVPAG